MINKDTSGSDVFTGRAVSEIIVHPTDSNILFTATTSGVAGIGQATVRRGFAAGGLYRTTNAMSADPRFDKTDDSGNTLRKPFGD